MKETALPPSTMSVAVRGIKQGQETLYGQLKQDDVDFWAEMPKQLFYGKIKDYILKLVDGLDELEGQAFESGASLEEIGLRRAVNRLTKSNLMSLITKVEKTSEAVTARREKERTGK